MRLTGAGLALAVLAWTGACADGLGPSPPASPLSVSDTVALVAPPATGAPPSLSGPSETEVAYVSLPPGTVADGNAALITNLTTGSTVTVPVLVGGFDPVAVGAVVGDTVAVVVRSLAGAVVLEAQLAVAAMRRPIVVRTDPPPQKRDVPLTTSIVIVFSEPIDSTTLTAASVQLRQGSVPVPGRLEVSTADHLSAVFVPAAPLAAAASYTLVVTQAIRDLDGASLDVAVTVPFTTAAGVALGRIAFVDWASVAVVSPDGSGLTRLADDGGQGWQYMYTSWSPDGGRIAFGSNRGGKWEIYAMNADGSAITKLTSTLGHTDSPAWSPDGTKIAFTSDSDGDFEIHVMNADGSGVTRVTDHPAADGDPAWSPDGTQIAFTSDRDISNEIYVMNADGTGLRRLTNDPAVEDLQPDWSPDGRKIAFTKVPGGVYVMNTDGSGVVRLTNGGGQATWSGDGTRLVCACNGVLYLVNADGSGFRQLTTVLGYEPSWSRASGGPPASASAPRSHWVGVATAR